MINKKYFLSLNKRRFKKLINQCIEKSIEYNKIIEESNKTALSYERLYGYERLLRYSNQHLKEVLSEKIIRIHIFINECYELRNKK